MKTVKDLLPLTESFFYILISLYSKPAHGYGIMQIAEQVSGGRVRIGAGTLYTALNTLLKKGLIAGTDKTDEVDSRRKMYCITETGRQVVKAELERLEELLESGRKMTQSGI